jgi:hypothetical protein
VVELKDPKQPYEMNWAAVAAYFSSVADVCLIQIRDIGRKVQSTPELMRTQRSTLQQEIFRYQLRREMALMFYHAILVGVTGVTSDGGLDIESSDAGKDDGTTPADNGTTVGE